MLKPGGQLYIAGPTIERRFHDRSDFPPHHRWWFSRPGLKQMLGLQGYDCTGILIERDAVLFIRNLLGKAANEFTKREFHGETRVAAPEMSNPAIALTYRALVKAGSAIFHALGISYCSTIVIGKLPPSADA